MCRHAVRQLEFAHAIERVLESMRSLQQCDELLPALFKPLASAGVLLSPTTGSPGRCRLSQRIFSTASQLQALQRRARPASLRQTPSVQGMGRIRAGQTAGSNVLLFILAPKPQIPSPSVFSARERRPNPHKFWGLITERRESQNWLLIELPGWMLMQPQRDILYSDMDATETERTGGSGWSRQKLYVCLRIHISSDMCFYSSAIGRLRMLAWYVHTR